MNPHRKRNESNQLDCMIPRRLEREETMNESDGDNETKANISTEHTHAHRLVYSNDTI